MAELNIDAALVSGRKLVQQREALVQLQARGPARVWGCGGAPNTRAASPARQRGPGGGGLATVRSQLALSASRTWRAAVSAPQPLNSEPTSWNTPQSKPPQKIPKATHARPPAASPAQPL